MIVEKRADGKVETEATIKVWVDGERYVRTAEGNGPVNALDRALRARDRRGAPAPARHRARQLQGPHPRRDARAPARSPACCSTPPTAQRRWGAIGVHENVIEASWDALVDSLASAGACRRARRALRVERRVDPARPAGPRRARGARGARGAALAASSRWARACRRSRRRSPRASACAHASAVSSGTAGAAPGAARRRASARATRSSPRRSRSSRQRQRRCCYERARPVFADIDPRDAEPRPEAAAAAITAAHHRAAAGAHLRLPGRHCPRFERARACRSSRTPARRSARVHADGVPVGGRGHPAAFGFYANKQLTTGEGGMLTSATRRSRSASTPSATRAARRTWAGSTTTGSASTTG